uniref:Prepilin-type N-terminal cleavage/methylation domain-containing protein n=1 Tax=uncultured Thiotrichaceae bacterium TaxID=298394 RepID=A0A6S6UM04_9GAMM|nr:MAG: Unknown protein [uncultured Thiotrichaceae bacterium]
MSKNITINKSKLIRLRGFTLVELLIAMTLGFFLIAGVGTVYIGSKKTYKLQAQVAELDENARHAMRALKQHIAHAGYASSTGVVLDNYIIPTGTDLAALEATCSDGVSNVSSMGPIAASFDGAGLAGDTIGLAFMADGSLASDCTGGVLRSECLPPDAPSVEARLIYNSFSVGNSANRNSIKGLVPMLRCGGSRNASRQDMARGVENIQFLYGVDFNGDGSVDNYWNATTVDNSPVYAWGKIISVRVGLLVRSVEPVFDDNLEVTYQVLDQNITKTDRFKRGVYTTTVRLKNVARRF